MYNNDLYLIIESPSVADYTILNESKNSDGKYTIKIKTILQRANEVNNNKRIYPREVLFESIQNTVIPKLKTKTGRYKLVGELDHPLPTGNPRIDMIRQGTPMYQHASHKFINIWFDGDYVMGEVETLSTPNGEIMAGLIRDNVEIGFSLRAFGKVVPDPRRGVNIVNNPMKIVTWDCVSNPSHSEAVLQEITENALVIPFSNPRNTMEMLYESYNITPDPSNGGICLDDVCYATIENAVSIRLDYVIESWINQIKKIESVKFLKEHGIL